MKTTLFRIFKDRWGAWIGIVLFIAILFLPTSEQFTPEKRNMLAIVGLMAVWWMTETLPLGVTALLPLILYPILGIMNTEKVAPNYMHHLVFLFMGGFIIAIALQKWQLHRTCIMFNYTTIQDYISNTKIFRWDLISRFLATIFTP